METRIGIGITERNRPEVYNKCLSEMYRYSENAIIKTVDDASMEPIGADYRFEENVGIAKAKNRCIQMLMEEGCTHFFLFDSDIYPKVAGWEIPYIESGLKHLSFTFPKYSDGMPTKRKLMGYPEPHIAEYDTPCGCMLYFTREVVEMIGGFDVGFDTWGFEHVDFSNRAHNVGLSKYRYADVAGSSGLFHSMDQHREIVSSVPASVRIRTIPKNKQRLQDNRNSLKFHPYK